MFADDAKFISSLLFNGCFFDWKRILLLFVFCVGLPSVLFLAFLGCPVLFVLVFLIL